MIKYLARYGVIHAVEVEQETDKNVVYRSPVSERVRIESKYAEDSSWHDTWEEAKAALLTRQAENIENLRLALRGAEMEAGRIRAMRPEIAQRG